MRIKGFMEDPKSNAVSLVSRGEFDSLVRRVSSLESKVRLLSTPPFTDQAKTPYDWGDQAGEPYYHNQGDIAGSLRGFVPWISTTTRFTERLTSSEFFWVTLGQAGTIGLSFAAMGALVSWGFGYPFWPLVIVPGVSGFFLSIGGLILHNRMELHTLIKGQADKDKRKRQELEVTVNKMDSKGKLAGVEKLCVAGITEEQIKEFAPQALRLGKLAINTIGGGGKLFSQGQAQALCAELEFMNYVTRAKGNQSRKLTKKGYKFFMSLLAPDDLKFYVDRLTREQLNELGLLTRECLTKLS